MRRGGGAAAPALPPPPGGGVPASSQEAGTPPPSMYPHPAGTWELSHPAGRTTGARPSQGPHRAGRLIRENIMAGETIITVIGNLTADPELRFTPSGAAVANFTLASTPRTFDKNSNEWKDGDALFLRCSVWREAAENVAESLTRGARVVVTGRLKQRSFETKEGEKRTVVELDVDEIGPSLRYATAKVSKAGRGSDTGAGF